MTAAITDKLSTTNSTLNNSTSCHGKRGHEHHMDQRYEVWFWVLVAVCTMILLIGAILNSLVIYFINQKPLTGAFRHLNTVVRHLAVSDLLYGILACPFALAQFKTGKI